MYSRIGKKLKVTAIIIGTVLSAGGIFFGISLLYAFNSLDMSTEGMVLGWMYILGGPFLGWVFSAADVWVRRNHRADAKHKREAEEK